jgi:hypothetical protein
MDEQDARPVLGRVVARGRPAPIEEVDPVAGVHHDDESIGLDGWIRRWDRIEDVVHAT